jgi:tryptophan-rich sensory protein
MVTITESAEPLGRSIPRQVMGLIGWLALCFGAAAVGSWATSTSVNDWYQSLNKPTWNPPDWLFGPVWTALYAAMAVAAWLVWRNSGWMSARTALTLFCVQLALNVAWSVLFFGLKNIGLAVLEIGLLWVAIALCASTFWRHSRAASLLLLPYLAWTSFAAILNFTIWNLNR